MDNYSPEARPHQRSYSNLRQHQRQSPRPHQQQSRASRRKALLVRIGTIFALLVIVATLFLLATRPEITVIALNGDQFTAVEVEELLRRIDITTRYQLRALSAETIEERLMQYAIFGDVAVAIRFPNQITVRVNEYAPLLSLPYRDEEEALRFAVISPQGVVSLPTDASIAPALPILFGLNYSTIDASARIPASYAPMLESMARIKAHYPEFYARITQVDIINKEQPEYELALHTDLVALPIVSDVPISIDALSTLLIAISHLSFDQIAESATHISVHDALPIIRSGDI